MALKCTKQVKRHIIITKECVDGKWAQGRCSVLSVFGKMKITTTMRCHQKHIRVTFKKYWRHQILLRMQGNSNSHTLLVGLSNDKGTWNTVWQFIINLYIWLLYNPAMPHLEIYAKKMKTFIYSKICTQIFIMVLFKFSKTKQSKKTGNKSNVLWNINNIIILIHPCNGYYFWIKKLHW